MILIPSFKPKEFGAERIDSHNKQLDWLLDHSDMDIHICSMNYDDEDYRSDSRIHYHDHDVIPPNAARKFLTDEVIESGTEWCVYCDNDAILKDDIGFGDRFLKSLHVLTNDIDVVVPVNPQTTPFNEFFGNPTTLDDFFEIEKAETLVFKRVRAIKGSFIVVRNTGKIPQWSYESKHTQGDDELFATQAIMNGCGVYTCSNIVLKELGSIKHQGTWLHGKERGANSHSVRIAKELGLPITEKRKKGELVKVLDSRRFYQNFWKKPEKELTIIVSE